MKKIILFLLFATTFFLGKSAIAQTIGTSPSSTTPLLEDPQRYEAVVSEALNRGISLSENQLAQGFIASYNGTEVKAIILVDSNNLELNYVAYNFLDRYVFVKALVSQSGDIKNYRFESLAESKLYYSFSLNSDGKVGSILIGEDIVSDGLRMIDISDAPTCKQQYPNDWNKCMDCAIAECSADWKCALSCGLQPWGCAVAFGLFCGGVLR